MKASIITIGTEILIGQIVDTNSAYLGEKLGEAGVTIVSRFSVSDQKDDMFKALERAQNDADLVILTGGLGPTKDDITKKVLAEYFGRGMYFDAKQYDRLKEFFKRINRPTTKAHEEQCFFPQNTIFMENAMGTAPGMLFHFGDTQFISMPGVPYEMKYIVENHVIPFIEKQRNEFLYHYTIQTAGCGESVLAEKIEDIETNLENHLSIAYLPSLGKVRIRVSGHGTKEEQLQADVDRTVNQIIERVSKYVFGENTDSLQSILGELLKEQQCTIGCAESCTGGLISNLITSVSGSSAYYQGSIISYSNRLKKELLGVKEEILDEYGAVSHQVVTQMVKGCIDKLGTDYAIAVSGIAGPTGGTPEKPVGTIYIGVGNKDDVSVKKLQLTKNRSKNIEYTAYAALNFMRLFIQGKLSDT